MRARTRRRLVQFLHLLGWGVMVSAVLGGASGSVFREAALLGVIQGALAGAINGAIVK
ncbi:MAG TPA: hypothetical protein VGA66_16225 [Mycobacterium sp.]